MCIPARLESPVLVFDAPQRGLTDPRVMVDLQLTSQELIYITAMRRNFVFIARPSTGDEGWCDLSSPSAHVRLLQEEYAASAESWTAHASMPSSAQLGLIPHMPSPRPGSTESAPHQPTPGAPRHEFEDREDDPMLGVPVGPLPANGVSTGQLSQADAWDDVHPLMGAAAFLLFRQPLSTGQLGEDPDEDTDEEPEPRAARRRWLVDFFALDIGAEDGGRPLLEPTGVPRCPDEAATPWRLTATPTQPLADPCILPSQLVACLQMTLHMAYKISLALSSLHTRPSSELRRAATTVQAFLAEWPAFAQPNAKSGREVDIRHLHVGPWNPARSGWTCCETRNPSPDGCPRTRVPIRLPAWLVPGCGLGHADFQDVLMHFAVTLDNAARSGKLDTRLAQQCAQGLRDARSEAAASSFDAAATPCSSFSLTHALADGWRRWRDEGDAVLQNFGGRAAMCAAQLCAVVESLAMMHNNVERRRQATAKHAGENTASGREDEIEVAGAVYQSGQLPSARWLKVMNETLAQLPINRLTTPCVTLLAAAARAMTTEAPESDLQKETSQGQGPETCVQASSEGQGHGRQLAIEATESLTVEWQAPPVLAPSGAGIVALAAEPAALYLIDMRGAVFVLTWQSASLWRPLRLQHVSTGYVTLDGSSPALLATAIDCGESISTLVTAEGDVASWNSIGGFDTCPDGAAAPRRVITALGTPDVGRWSPLRIALSGGVSSLKLPRHWTCCACERDNETFRPRCGGCGRTRPKDQPQYSIAENSDCESSFTPRNIAVSHPQLLEAAHLFKCDPLARLHNYQGSVLAVTTSGNIFCWGAVPPWEDPCLHMYRRGAALRIRDGAVTGESGSTALPSSKEEREYLILTHGPLGVVFRPGAALENSVSTVAALIAYLEGYEILRTDADLEDLPLRREQKGITLRGGLLLERAVDKPKVSRNCREIELAVLFLRA